MEENQKDFEKRVQELYEFAKEKEIFIGAVQQINKENGYIEIVPLFRNLKKEVVVAEKTSDDNAN